MRKTAFFLFLFLILSLPSVLAGDVSSLNIVSDFANSPEFNGFLAIVPNVLFISLVIPVFIYFRYGRAGKQDSNQKFDGRIPTEDSPLFVDAFYSNITEVGDISRFGIEATLMDLIRRGYVKVDESSKNGDVVLIVDGKSDLKDYEKSLLDALALLSKDDKISFKAISGKSREKFEKRINKLELDYEKRHKNDMDQLFKSKGNVYIKLYSIIVGFLAFVFFILSDNSSISSAMDAYFISFAVLVICFLMFLFPNTVGGKWTRKGLENESKWKAFKNYIIEGGKIPKDDFDEYLIYAAAMGCADGLIENIDKCEDDLVLYCKMGGFKQFSDLMTSIAAVNVNVIGSKGRRKR